MSQLLPFPPSRLDPGSALNHGNKPTPPMSAIQQALRRAKRTSSTPNTVPTTCFLPSSFSNPLSAVEELSWTRTSVIWSKGGSIYRTYSFAHQHQPVIQALFATFDLPPSHSHSQSSSSPVATTSAVRLDDPNATFGPFHPVGPPAWTEDPLALPIHPTTPRTQPSPRPERFIVVFLSDIAFAYPLKLGGSIPFQLPFHLRRAWAMQRGILLEREEEGNESAEPNQTPDLPTLYSLLGPADEMKVVAATLGLSGLAPTSIPPHSHPHHPGIDEPVQNLQERIIFVSDQSNEEEPALVTTNAATGKVSIWAYAAIPPLIEEELNGNDRKRGGGDGTEEGGDSSTKRKGKERETSGGKDVQASRPKRKRSSIVNTSSSHQTITGDRSHRRASYSNNPGSTSIGALNEADLLEALGETMGTAAGMKRTTSAMSALAASDRRGSVTRNELSITMDRMALGNALGGGGGGGEMDREATLLLGDSEESRMVSDVFITKAYELDLAQPGSRAFEEANAFIFDSRSSNSILAILLPSSSSLLLLTLSWSQTGSLVVTPLRQTYAIAATPVLATRSTILDLLILGREGNWSTLSAGAQAESITGPILSRGGGGGRRIKRVDGDRSGFFTVSFEDGSRFAAAMPSPPDGLARRILHTIAEVIPLSDYVQFWREVARCKANDPTVDYFQIIRDVLFNLFAVPSTIIEPSDSWSEFINATDGNSTSDPALSTLRSSASRLETSPVVSRTQSTTRELLEAVVLGLHLLSEDCKVLAETQQDHVKLAAVLLPLVTTLGNPSWLDAYLRKTGGALVPLAQAAVWTGPTSLPAHPPDLISSLSTLLSGRSKPPSFSLSSIAPSYNFTPSNFYGPTTPCLTTFQIIATYEALSTLSGPSTALLRAQQSVRVMSSMGWTSEFVARLVFGLGVPCREAIRMCQLEAPEGWPVEAYQLIRRPDLARQICGVGRKKSSTPKVSLALFTTESICENAKSGIPPKDISVKVQSDAAPVPKATRFNEDRRLEEVARMLQYSESVTISAGDRTLDQLTPQVQQSILTALSNRTLALPIGYAMFTYRSATRPIIESVAISRINTSARILPMPSPVALVDKEPRDSPSSTTSDRLEWPEFHSGVAAALQLHPGQSGNLDSSQISFNKPADLDARHAGFLLGLGLMGRIGALIVNQAFEYLKMKHDPTSIGLLLGLAVTYLGTGDPKVTSLISVHLTALHPPNSSPLNVSGITQAAGLVGIGLLYLGTRRRTLADIMVRELCAIKVTSIEDPAACREAYALSAGFAFGLIMLGSGTESATTSNEVTLLRTFRALILGESNHPLPGATPSSNVTDVNITSSAATVAIGLTYLRTERQDVADMLEIPDTARRLDYVRSDLLLLRTLARSMILWSSISSSKIWVESHIPAFITDAFKSPQAGIKPDGDLDIARWNIVAGACFAMGLKFAGTAAAEAHSTLIHYLDRLTRAAYVKASTVQGKIKRHAIRCCLSVVAISLSMVMAGTGEINVLRRLRVAHGHFSEGVTYGTHLASHMALGLLFVGGGQYTLGTSNSAIAALVIAFFPAFPPLPTENRAHLQAYRHLWTLAIEPRCLQVRDVDTNEPTFLPIKLRLVEHADVARAKQLVAKQLVAPTLIPEIQLIDTIQIDSPRYWSFALHLRSNPDHLASFLRDATIFVKRRTGHLSYAQDPRGIRSIFTRSKSETGSSVYDFGETARMLAASATGLRDFVSAFSDDPEAIAAVAHLCHPAGSNSPPTAFEAFSASVLLECLTRDKRDTIAVYHAMYHANALLGLAKMTPTSLVALEQLRFVEGFYRRGSYRSVFGRSRSKPSAGRDPLLQLAFVEHVASTLSNRAKTLVADPSLASYARKYLATSKWPVDQDAGRALSVVLSVQDAPDSTSLQILRGYALGMIQRVRMGDEAVDLLAVLTLMVHGTGQAAEDLGGRAWQQDFTALAVDVWMGMST